MSATTELGRWLEWDSNFWSQQMIHVNDPSQDFEAGETIAFAQALVDAADIPRLSDAIVLGFTPADIRVTLDRPLARRPPMSIEEIRAAQPYDASDLIRIARESHRITRFYADPGFPDERCHDLYENWITNSYLGWADQVLVAGHPARGYVTIHLDGDTASIGLIAVDEQYRGQGIGQRLCHAAFRWAQAAGATRMTVVTQGRNIAAQRLFQRCGFRTASTEVWLHKWYR